ncbi:MAG TPA: hemolysin III family protein [Acidimicrobiales bacterium]|nr:hemolysin III family protein [Acidimicrobiales bacterium]
MNPDGMATAIAKPLLRGWLHLLCFFLAVPTGIWLVAGAPTSRARVGAAVYAVGLSALFGVSGFYHRGRWGPSWRARMQRLDHSTIFVMIAGSYTPLCLVVLRGWAAAGLLIAVWTGAAVGAALSWYPSRRSALACNVLYIALGWLVVAAGPQLLTRIERTDFVLLAIGGLLFTVGAVTLATHWPDPSPRFFGYHEVWHVLVVAAVVCQLVAIASVVRSKVPL